MSTKRKIRRLIRERLIREAKPARKRHSVCICTPIGSATGIHNSLIDFCMVMQQQGYHWEKAKNHSAALSRNNLVDICLLQDRWEYLFFVDADTVPPMNAIDQLLTHCKDVVSAATPVLIKDTLTWNVFPIDQANYITCNYEEKRPRVTLQTDKQSILPFDKLPNKLFKCRAIGAAAFLIRTEVLKCLKFPYFKWITELKGVPNSDSWTKSRVRREYLIRSEDCFFSEQVLDAGFELWADPAVQCEHFKSVGLKTIPQIRYRSEGNN